MGRHVSIVDVLNVGDRDSLDDSSSMVRFGQAVEVVRVRAAPAGRRVSEALASEDAAEHGRICGLRGFHGLV